MYGPVQSGLDGAYQEVYPNRQEDDLCGDCGERARAGDDWLCQRCRRKLNKVLRRAALATGNTSLVLAWANAEMERQLTEMEPDDDKLPF